MNIKQTLKKILPQRLWSTLRVWRVRYTLARYRHRRVRHSYGGYQLELELVDPMGAGWYDRDWPELAEIALLRRHRLRPGARVFDIGAHQCVVALMLSKTVGPQGSVLAVEASAENCRAGEQNRKLNGVENLQILHAAGAARSGTLIFNRGTNGQVDDGSAEWGQVEVQAFSVDDLAERYGAPDVLFIDVEGFECELLQGAQKTLARRPDCFIEVHVGAGLEKFGGSVERLWELLPTDYSFFVAPPDSAFGPLNNNRSVLQGRFFLIAVPSQHASVTEQSGLIPVNAQTGEGRAAR